MNAERVNMSTGDIFKRQIRERGKPERTGNQPMAVLKGDLASITAQLEQCAMYRRSHLSGWISKSLLMSTA